MNERFITNWVSLAEVDLTHGIVASDASGCLFNRVAENELVTETDNERVNALESAVEDGLGPLNFIRTKVAVDVNELILLARALYITKFS